MDNIATKLKIKNLENFTRESLCTEIMNKLFYLEKFSVGKDKKTYLIIPSNHPKYKFPLNLEDRVEYVKNKVTQIIKGINIKFVVKNKDNTKYEISFNYDFQKNDVEKIINYGWKKEDNNYSMVIE